MLATVMIHYVSELLVWEIELEKLTIILIDSM